MIENVTLGQIALIVAFVVALGKGWDYLIAKYKKPTDDLESKISARLDRIEADNKMSLKVLVSLLQHEITGDHVNDMTKLYEELQQFIIDK